MGLNKNIFQKCDSTLILYVNIHANMTPVYPVLKATCSVAIRKQQHRAFSAASCWNVTIFIGARVSLPGPAFTLKWSHTLKVKVNQNSMILIKSCSLLISGSQPFRFATPQSSQVGVHDPPAQAYTHTYICMYVSVNTHIHSHITEVTVRVNMYKDRVYSLMVLQALLFSTTIWWPSEIISWPLWRSRPPVDNHCSKRWLWRL